MLSGRRIHVCVTGGIAAYKAVEFVRELQRAGATVQVAMSANAQAFVGPLTFQAITHAPVLTRTLDASEEMAIGHIAFAQECDALAVVPATANILGKAANGLGDDVVSTVLLACDAPIVAAPAMNTQMWANPAVQRNLATLSEAGWHLVEPDAGQLACGAVGPGRLAEPSSIAAAVAGVLATGDFAGKHVVVSAGPTREPIDPVRFLSNPSTGRMGFAVARAAAARGARVTLVHGPVSLSTPEGVQAIPVGTAVEMHAAITNIDDADAVVMTAAVADWRPAQVATKKQPKTGEEKSLQLVRNPDILASLGAARTGDTPVLVGFAAETGDPVESAASKRVRKGVDLIVANDVSAAGSGFGTDTNQVWLVGASVEKLPLISKDQVAARIIEWIAERL